VTEVADVSVVHVKTFRVCTRLARIVVHTCPYQLSLLFLAGTQYICSSFSACSIWFNVSLERSYV